MKSGLAELPESPNDRESQDPAFSESPIDRESQGPAFSESPMNRESQGSAFSESPIHRESEASAFSESPIHRESESRDDATMAVRQARSCRGRRSGRRAGGAGDRRPGSRRGRRAGRPRDPPGPDLAAMEPPGEAVPRTRWVDRGRLERRLVAAVQAGTDFPSPLQGAFPS